MTTTITAWFDFEHTPVMSHFEFEGQLRRQKHLQHLTITRWSIQQKKTVYYATTERPEALLLLGMAIQIISDEIEQRSKRQLEKQTETGRGTAG